MTTSHVLRNGFADGAGPQDGGGGIFLAAPASQGTNVQVQFTAFVDNVVGSSAALRCSSARRPPLDMRRWCHSILPLHPQQRPSGRVWERTQHCSSRRIVRARCTAAALQQLLQGARRARPHYARRGCRERAERVVVLTC